MIPASFHADPERTLIGLYVRLLLLGGLLLGLLLLLLMAAPLHRSGPAAARGPDGLPLPRIPGNRAPDRANGLVTRVVPDDHVAAEARLAAERMALLSPQALRLNKRMLREFATPPLSSAEQRKSHYAFADSAEHREGLAAFNQKRSPRF